MLKIKDNIALKELEKFGFVKKKMTDFCSDVKYWYTLNESEYDCICIMKDREIFFGIDCYGETHDIIYDLIKANMVVKIDD